MIKEKMNKNDSLVIGCLLILLLVASGLSYFLKKFEYLPISILFILVIISNIKLKEIENKEKKKSKNDIEMYDYLILNNGDSVKDFNSKNIIFNKEIITFLKESNNTLLIEPYLNFMINFKDLKIKELIFNFYLLENNKKENKDLKNKNLILLNTFQKTNFENSNSSILLISYIFAIILMWLFLMEVFIK